MLSSTRPMPEMTMTGAMEAVRICTTDGVGIA